MVRILLSALFVFSFLRADLLDDKIKSLMNEREYLIQKKLINIIFENRENYYINSEKVDSINIIKELKKNGLINLFFDAPKKLKVTFLTDKNPLLFMKIVSDSLNSMGYGYFLTKEVVKNTKGVKWSIILSTEYLIDPIFFSKELQKRGCFIEDVSKIDEVYWEYDINTENAILLAERVELDSTQKLKKPIKPYWINVEDAVRIELKSHRIDRWFPYVVFYDENLNILDHYKSNDTQKRIRLSVPHNARYAKIDDIYTLDNIKRGLSVYLFSN